MFSSLRQRIRDGNTRHQKWGTQTRWPSPDRGSWRRIACRLRHQNHLARSNEGLRSGDEQVLKIEIGASHSVSLEPLAARHMKKTASLMNSVEESKRSLRAVRTRTATGMDAENKINGQA